MSLGGWGTPKVSHSDRNPEMDDPKNLALHCFTASGLVLEKEADCGCFGSMVITSGNG